MAPTVADIVRRNDAHKQVGQRISRAKVPIDLKIYDYDPTWPQSFTTFKTALVNALGPKALSIDHVGSTSVPGLAAKDIVDIDLVVADSTDEAAYIPALEAAGWHFLLREPHWNEHRYFRQYGPTAALHVFGPEAPEPARHRILRDWLMAHPEDRELYANAKRNASSQSIEAGEVNDQYNARKEKVILEILDRAFRSLGYIE